MVKQSNNKNKKSFSCFVPILGIFAMCLCGLSSCVSYESRLQLIKQNLASLCKDGDYAYDNIEGNRIKIDFDTEISKSGSGTQPLPNFDYYWVSLLLFNETNYFFLIEKKTEPGFHEEMICKTDLDLNNIEVIYNFGKEIDKCNSGFDNRIFLRVDDTGLVFDTRTGTIKETEPESSDDTLTKCSRKEYYEYLGYSFGKCERKNNYCQYYIDDTRYTFDEKNIDNAVFQVMNDCGFEPFYYFASSSEKRAVLYYARIDAFLDVHACLVVQYDCNSGKVNSYNLFNHCDKYNFRLYPRIY